MDEELRKAIADYFDAGDFAELLGVSTMQIIEAFPEEVEDALDDLLEIIGVAQPTEDDYSEGEE